MVYSTAHPSLVLPLLLLCFLGSYLLHLLQHILVAQKVRVSWRIVVAQSVVLFMFAPQGLYQALVPPNLTLGPLHLLLGTLGFQATGAATSIEVSPRLNSIAVYVHQCT